MWDLTATLKHLNANAGAKSKGLCATYVRQAIEAGGVKLKRTLSAKDYGASLIEVGFTALKAAPSTPLAGDVVVIAAIEGQPHGHIAMFNGQQWLSDFVQQNGYYPGPGYRKAQPTATFYRFPLSTKTHVDKVWRGQQYGMYA